MTSTAQVFHVLRKDIRLNAWFLTAYVAVVGYALAQVLSFTPAPFGSGGLLVIMIGLILIALALQADSPYRVDAFWVTRPLNRTSVFTAKIALTIVLVLIAFVAEAIIYFVHRASAADIAVMLPMNALAFASILSTAFLLGSITPNLTIFLLSALFVYIGQFVITNFVASRWLTAGPGQFTTPVLWPLIALGLSAAVVWYQYRSRTRAIWLVVGFMAVSYVLGIWALSRRKEIQTIQPDLPMAVRAPVHAWLDNVVYAGGDKVVGLIVQLRGGSDRYAYVFSAMPTLRSAGGTTSKIDDNGLNSRAALNRPVIPGLSADIWRRERNRSAGLPAQLLLTPSQHTQLEEPGSAIYLKGVVQVWEPHVSSQTALRSGNTIVSSGERVRINDIRPNSDDMIALSISSISRVPEPNVSRGLFDFALVHTRTGDAFGLMQGGGRSFGVGSLPLANVRRRNVGLVLERNARSNYALQVDEFQLVRIRWRSLGSYPVDIEVVKQRPEQPR